MFFAWAFEGMGENQIAALTITNAKLFISTGLQ